MNFNEIDISSELQRAISELGFETPTPIQAETIPLILDSEKDLIGLAQTGTGKTAAYGLPILNKINHDDGKVQALILCPTRELGMQITKDLEAYSKYLPAVNIVTVYGGAPIDRQIRQLKKASQIVVGTPGRTLDLIKRRELKLKNVKYLILDEADEMLNMGFKEDLDAILSKTHTSKQTLLYSATMPPDIRRIANDYMNEPYEISVGKKNHSTENVSHEYYVMNAKNRYAALKRIVDINPKIYGIVFCRTRSETKDVADKLMQEGYNADALHGDLSQAQRDFVMNKFRQGTIQLLVATDVAARGLDVNNLTHVINYNLPDDNEAYIHRSGRTGRAGKTGISISLLHTKETNKLKPLEKKTGKKFEYKKIPGGREICEKQLFNLVDKMEKTTVNHEEIGTFMPEIYEKLSVLSREELIQQFVSVEFNRFLDYYKNAGDINADTRSNNDNDSGDRRKGRRRDSERNEDFSRFFINIGKKDKLNVAKLIGMINEYTDSNNIEIGKVDLMTTFSFFEVEPKYEDLILNAFKQKRYGSRKIVVDLSKPDKNGGGNNGGGNNRSRSRNSDKDFGKRKKRRR